MMLAVRTKKGTALDANRDRRDPAFGPAIVATSAKAGRDLTVLPAAFYS